MFQPMHQSGLLFLPRGLQRRTQAVKWLKRVHAWTGLWGALLFLLLGASGVLLNHRNLLKIETGAPVEVSAVDVPVAPGLIADAEGLGAWAKRRFDLPGEGRAPPPEPAGARRFGNSTVPQAEKWVRTFALTDARVIVEHVPGAAHVTAKREAVGLLATLKNLHKGTGLGVAWVLFLDTIAGALIAMSLTGFLLWTRLHGTRLLAGGIVLVSLGLALSAVLPALS